VRRRRPELWRKQTWLLQYDNFHPYPAVSGEIQMTVIPHSPYSPDLTPFDFSLFPKMKLKLKGRRFVTTEEIQAESQRVFDTDRKGLPGSVPKMKKTVGPVSTSGRELLRWLWRPIGLRVSCMMFTALVRTILGRPSYTYPPNYPAPRLRMSSP
jgi:hypothetical protein